MLSSFITILWSLSGVFSSPVHQQTVAIDRLA